MADGAIVDTDEETVFIGKCIADALRTAGINVESHEDERYWIRSTGFDWKRRWRPYFSFDRYAQEDPLTQSLPTVQYLAECLSRTERLRTQLYRLQQEFLS